MNQFEEEIRRKKKQQKFVVPEEQGDYGTQGFMKDWRNTQRFNRGFLPGSISGMTGRSSDRSAGPAGLDGWDWWNLTYDRLAPNGTTSGSTNQIWRRSADAKGFTGEVWDQDRGTWRLANQQDTLERDNPRHYNSQYGYIARGFADRKNYKG